MTIYAPCLCDEVMTYSMDNGESELIQSDFEKFVFLVEPKLRRAFVASYGGERGREATAEALAYAWEHWSRIKDMDNPAGYLYRVGQSRTRSKKKALVFPLPDHEVETFEPGLIPGLLKLTQKQRQSVVLVYGFGWTLREVADLNGCKITTIQNHLERAMHKLRKSLGAESDESN
ncbi:MAG: hypothetical protein HKL80_11700 [Acidimicrobiales bacterium]|nr:hypothetical protein [Acidimicrobiales bacterium]